MGGGISRYPDWDDDDDDRPRRDRFGEDYDDDIRLRRVRGETSGAITAIGIVTIIVGSVGLMLGSCMFLSFLIASNERGRMQFPEDQIGYAFIVVMMVSIVLWSIGMIVGGIGVLSRGSWGRVLTLVLSGFGILFGFGCIVVVILALASPAPPRGAPDPRIAIFLIFIVTAFLLIGHALWAFIALLGARAASEFR